MSTGYIERRDHLALRLLRSPLSSVPCVIHIRVLLAAIGQRLHVGHANHAEHVLAVDHGQVIADLGRLLADAVRDHVDGDTVQ